VVCSDLSFLVWLVTSVANSECWNGKRDHLIKARFRRVIFTTSKFYNLKILQPQGFTTFEVVKPFTTYKRGVRGCENRTNGRGWKNITNGRGCENITNGRGCENI